jgi:ribose/xylose/arabinose/galactoside ABC-type transport system permease subunit
VRFWHDEMASLRKRFQSLARPDAIIVYVLLIGIVAMSVYFASQSSAFLTTENFKVIGTNSAALGVVAVALTILVISGYVDLSIGSIAALSGTVTALAVYSWQWDPIVGIALGIIVGGAIGAVNGFLCAILGFSAIIVTLGMLGILRGVTLLVKNTPVFGDNATLTRIGAGEFAGVPIMILFALGAFVLGAIFLSYTPWGRYIYAIGANPQAAFLSALPVRALPFCMFVVTGASAGLAGVLLTARQAGASPGDQGVGLELNALTVVLLGGVAFVGGRGRLTGVFAAVLFLGILQDGLILTNVTPYVQLVVGGLALVFAAGLDIGVTWFSEQLQSRRQLGGRLGGERRVLTEDPIAHGRSE